MSFVFQAFRLCGICTRVCCGQLFGKLGVLLCRPARVLLSAIDWVRVGALSSGTLLAITMANSKLDQKARD